MVWPIPSHPNKHLIRDLWPDKHLYATILLTLGASLAAAYSFVVYLVPIRYANEMPTFIGGMPMPWGILLPATAIALAVASYRLRIPGLGFGAASIDVLTFGALGVSALLGVVACYFLLRARKEGEHENPKTAALSPDLWPDKTLAAALLFVVGGLAALVWGLAILTGWLDVRAYDGVLWGVLSLAAGVVALAAAAMCYWQRGRSLAFAGAIALVVSGSFVVIGPALGIAAIALLVRAGSEGEFDAASV